MRNLAIAACLAVAALGLTAAAPLPPGVDELTLAQAKCGNDICIGSANAQLHVKGNIIADKPILSGTSANVIIDAGVTIVGSTVVTGTATAGVSKPDVLDAGYGRINGDFQVAGQFIPFRPIKCGADVACGTVALSSGTPSTATKTVEASSTCVCWPVGTTAAIAAGGCAANVSSTTATFTGPNTVTTTVAWLCFK